MPHQGTGSILIVDDSSATRLLLTRGLLAAGAMRSSIVTCCDGLEALDIIRDEEPYLVLTDINMPNLDGHEFIRRLSESGQLARTSVIVVSSISNMVEINQLFAAGVAAVFRKPLDVKTLAREFRPFLKDATTFIEEVG